MFLKCPLSSATRPNFYPSPPVDWENDILQKSKRWKHGKNFEHGLNELICCGKAAKFATVDTIYISKDAWDFNLVLLASYWVELSQIQLNDIWQRTASLTETNLSIAKTWMSTLNHTPTMCCYTLFDKSVYLSWVSSYHNNRINALF